VLVDKFSHFWRPNGINHKKPAPLSAKIRQIEQKSGNFPLKTG
jgi:hypothetical protein